MRWNLFLVSAWVKVMLPGRWVNAGQLGPGLAAGGVARNDNAKHQPRRIRPTAGERYSAWQAINKSAARGIEPPRVGGKLGGVEMGETTAIARGGMQ